MGVSPQCSSKPTGVWPHNPRTPGEWLNWGSPFPNSCAETVPASVSPLRILKAASALLLGMKAKIQAWNNVVQPQYPLVSPFFGPSPYPIP